MTHTLVGSSENRIVLITLLNPFSARIETAEIMDELMAILGTPLTKEVYTIYDLRRVSFSFSDIVSGVGRGIATRRNEFEKQLDDLGRLVLIGTGPYVTVGATTASRFSPQKPIRVFPTPEEALAYAEGELDKLKIQEAEKAPTSQKPSQSPVSQAADTASATLQPAQPPAHQETDRTPSNQETSKPSANHETGTTTTSQEPRKPSVS